MDVDNNPSGPSVPLTVPPPPGQSPDQLQPGGTHPPVIIRRRAPIACRRCRRMRSKCVAHEKGKPPCQACIDAGLAPSECVFPLRGEPDLDREYRHPRVRSDKSKKRDVTKMKSVDESIPVRLPVPAAPSQVKGGDEWDLLPPLLEVLDAVNTFTRHYFQLGFIPKQLFPERLQANPRSVSVFFLLGILSVSARLTPALVRRYGSAVKASEIFMERASALAQTEVYKEPSLERCQAFYLLSIAQQGSGLKYQSSINMAISIRMATLMQLHREETYVLQNPTRELIIRAESARRTLWMLHSQDNLHSGPHSPVSLSASDITTLLPASEEDFAAAREPELRAALEDTPPALENPALVHDKRRSLFASLIQAHYYWGAISRQAINKSKSMRPWDSSSEYAQMQRRLDHWESQLPERHRWSPASLKKYRQESLELAYLGVTMIPRLCNIVLRKAYLQEMLSDNKSDPTLTSFWNKMAHELFQNVEDLYQQIETQFSERPSEEGPGAQMAAFCVYTCGFLACYPHRFPHICPNHSITRNASQMVERILDILNHCRTVWPLASRWYEHLERFYKTQSVVPVGAEGGMDDSRDPIPHVLQQAPKGQDMRSGSQTSISPIPGRDGQPASNPAVTIAPLSTPPVVSTSYAGAAGIAPPTSVAQAQTVPQPLPPQQHMLPSHSQVEVTPATVPVPQGPAAPRPPTTDGLGLLLEAFDTHQAASGAAAPPNVVVAGPTTITTVPQPPHSQHQAQATFSPHVPTQQQQAYFPPQTQPQPNPHATGLVMNDGYEHELSYYMHTNNVSGIQSGWSGGGSMFGY